MYGAKLHRSADGRAQRPHPGLDILEYLILAPGLLPASIKGRGLQSLHALTGHARSKFANAAACANA